MKVKLQHTIEATVYHEAGHVAMAFYLGIKIQGITIARAGVGMAYYMMYFPAADCVMSSKKKRCKIDLNKLDAKFRDFALVCLAGYTAEFMHLKMRLPYEGLLIFDEYEDPDRPKNDYSKLEWQMEKANQFLDSDRYDDVCFRKWNVETRKILRKENVWMAIEALSKYILSKEQDFDKETGIFIEASDIENILGKFIPKPTVNSLIAV